MAEIHRRPEKNLSNDRYQHTLGVAYTAATFTMRYQASIEDTELAGLSHDYAKEYNKKESLSIAGKSGIRSSAADMVAPQTWYAIIGPVAAEKRYGVAKSEILSAIRWHTTGRREMSLLEKIVSAVDYIEPNHNRVDNFAETRYLVFQDLDFCVYRTTADTPRHLASEQTHVDQETEECYQWLKEIEKYDDK